MVPVTLGLGLINFNAVIDTLFASRLLDPELAPTAIDKAFRVYMLPQGIFSVAIATVLFPTMSRLAVRADWDGFRGTVAMGLRQMAFLLIPASVIVAVLATPIIRLLYQRGAFTPEQTTVVAGALAAFSLGLSFNGAMLMLNRAFFSLQENWIPTLVALGNLGLNALLDWAFYRVGVWGIPLSTAVVNIAGTAVLFWLLRDRLDGLPVKPILGTVWRVLVASAVLGAVAYVVWRGIDSLVGQRFVDQAVALLGGIAAGVVAYWIFLPFARDSRARLVTLVESPLPAELNHAPEPHPQLLDHRPHRPWEVDAGRPHSRAHRHGRGSRDARPAARLDGPRARARDHDQGPGRARRAGRATSST